MYLKYSIGFLIASLIQAGTIMLAETLGISSLGAKLTVMQLITHILAGQIAGYVLLYIMRKSEVINKVNIWVIGIIWGIIVWAIILTINSMQGTIKAPWSQGLSSVLSSMIAFIIYSVISTYTIKKYIHKS